MRKRDSHFFAYEAGGWDGVRLLFDRLFVHPEYQRRGIASAICDALEASVSETVSAITVNASITACGFFERRDYTVVRRQEVRRNGETLVNYAMMRKRDGGFFSLSLV